MNLRRAFERASGGGIVPEAKDGLWDRDDFTTKLASAFTVTAGGTNSVVTGVDVQHTSCILCTVTAVGDATRICSANASQGFFFGGGQFYVEWCGYIDTLSDGVNNLVVRVGVGDDAGVADFVDGVYFEYDFATHGHHRWMFCTASNSVRTKTDTGVLAVASSFQRLRATVNADGSRATPSLDGAGATANTTNIPVAVTRSSNFEAQTIKQLGAAARVSTWDYWELRQTYSVPR